MPTTESACIARSRQRASASPWNLIARRKFSSTVYQGNSVLSWNTKATSRGRGRSIVIPEIETEPAVGCASPPMMLSSVLLPQPDGPSRQTNSLLRISSEMSSSACTLCEASCPEKVIDTWSTAMTVSSRVVLVNAWACCCSAVTSQVYRDELVVVNDFRLRDEVEDAELLERIADDVDRHRIPRSVGREVRHLGIVDFRRDALAHVHDLGARLHGEVLVGLHEGHRLEPAAQEPTQQLSALLDHLVAGKDDVGVEMLLDVAEQENVAALVLLLQLVAGRRFNDHAVKLAALHGGKASRHRAERHDLDAVVPPALLLRQLAREPISKRAQRRDADALALEIGDRADR